MGGGGIRSWMLVWSILGKRQEKTKTKKVRKGASMQMVEWNSYGKASEQYCFNHLKSFQCSGADPRILASLCITFHSFSLFDSLILTS